MTIFVPTWTQGGSYNAQTDRTNGRAADWDEGVASRIDLKVTQRGAGANMTVDVAAGGCIVQGDDSANQGNYNVFNDATFNLTGFVATSANTRYDAVVMRINDPTAGGAAGNTATIERVAGTQAASPVIPTIGNSMLLLAIIGPFTTSTTLINNAMIHDAYTGTGPTGVAGARLLQGFRDAPGTLKDGFNPVAPNGWLIAAGQAISRTTFARLFEHLGTTFGVGDGSTTFNIPDLRGRDMVALDNQGGVDAGVLSVANTLGLTGGEELHVLTATELAAHSHGITDPGHFHDEQLDMATGIGHLGPGTNSTAGGIIGPFSDSGIDTLPKTTGITINNNTPAGSAHNNMPPYILGYKIIRT